jgi:AFG3 family protein
VESFERRLEEAQKALNIPSKDFIPVTYHDEIDWAAELISSIPMIAIAGTSIFPREF